VAQVVIAQLIDIPAWLNLAREVEPLFGPMCSDPAFHHALQKNINRGTALCVPEADGVCYQSCGRTRLFCGCDTPTKNLAESAKTF
jgi:hypothetical protein